MKMSHFHFYQNRRMKLKKELRAVKEINEQERKKRDEPGDDDHVDGGVDDDVDVDVGDVLCQEEEGRAR